MRKLVVGAQLSLDGVMQSAHGPSEDTSGGFALGGWIVPFRSKEGGEELARMMEPPFDLLLGRKTYENFAGYWPKQDENGPAGWIARKFNACKKYVVSGSGKVDLRWSGSVLLRGVDEVKKLKEQDGPQLLTQGSPSLAQALLAHDLVDALTLFLAPAVVGSGKRLWAEGSAPRAFKLVSSRVASSGTIIAHYEKAGELKTGSM